MSPEDLERYILTMREHNVTVFKTPEIHLELGPAPAPASSAKEKPSQKLSYDHFLFAATEGLPEDE